MTLAGIKHLNRLEQVLARMEWTDEDIVEGLMSDPRGRIVEGISTNIFLVSGGRLITPTIDSCGVAGVMRGYIIEEVSRSLGIAVATTNCERAPRRGAQELFICNAVIGVPPVRKREQKPCRRVGDAQDTRPRGAAVRGLAALVAMFRRRSRSACCRCFLPARRCSTGLTNPGASTRQNWWS
ncbi:MAG: aminotransferase class IV [Anaerolineales bacterium]|nr:aminotransferase class IV [Anaerolineales bacterium]